MRMRTDRMHGFIVVGLESGEEDIPPPPVSFETRRGVRFAFWTAVLGTEDRCIIALLIILPLLACLHCVLYRVQSWRTTGACGILTKMDHWGRHGSDPQTRAESPDMGAWLHL